jgi:isoleucyl-tRNA synthetase
MYEMFQDGTKASADSQNVLDRWIIARLQELVNDSTAGYKNYELDKATRPISDFIDDLSVWYLRRSRDRFKGDDGADKALALATLRHTLQTLALVMAPVMPFYAEYLWQAVKEEGDAESVHLGKWPEVGEVDRDVIANMMNVRSYANNGLKLRTEKKINVRQPLQLFWIKSNVVPEGWNEVSDILADELNVKEVKLDSGKGQDEQACDFDWNLTPELIAEGNVRELMRAVQGRRKTEGLEPADAIALTISASDTGRAAIEANRDMLVKTVGAGELNFSDIDGEVVATDTEQFIFSLKKII